MPIYEYECKKCGKVSSFIEKVDQKRGWFSRRRCEECGSSRLKRVISNCSASFSRTEAETLDELSKMAPVRFVQKSPGHISPPAGGCPYANAHAHDSSE